MHMFDPLTSRDQVIMDVIHSPKNSRTEEYKRMIPKIDMIDKRFYINSYGNCCWTLYKWYGLSIKINP